MATFTRSANRSNPQRMSVASLAIQTRAPGARSIACSLQTRQPNHSALSTTTSNARTCSASNPGLTTRLRPFLSHTSNASSCAAERRHTLSAWRLLGNQSSPLRPCLLCAFDHVATLLCDYATHSFRQPLGRIRAG
jgi:hypothetical protein